MKNSADFRIAVLEGDGIGVEITEPAMRLVEKAASRVGGFSVTAEALPAGAGYLREHGVALPKSTLDAAGAADAIFLGAMGLPDVRYPDGTEATPQLDLRFEFGLYAGVRPVRAVKGVKPVLADSRAAEIDFVILRESTEGLFASHGKGEVSRDRVSETLVMTRETTERLHDFGLKLARSRIGRGGKGRATSVDKANIFRAFAWFREIFYERAAAFPDVACDHLYIDACALNMVTRPWDLDVLITENMFGDIISDLGAGLIGGMGYAPSADIGDAHAVFQPCHGSAPDIAGKGIANPTAMILSGAMMLEWLGEERGVTEAAKAGALLRAAVDGAFEGGDLVTPELGGKAGTYDVFAAVEAALERADVG